MLTVDRFEWITILLEITLPASPDLFLLLRRDLVAVRLVVGFFVGVGLYRGLDGIELAQLSRSGAPCLTQS